MDDLPLKWEKVKSEIIGYDEIFKEIPVKSVILTMEAVIFEKNNSLHYEVEPDLTVCGSSEQIKQVVMILLDNGIKYTKPEGSITLTLQKRHHDVLLTVTNTSEGIPPEHLDRIFDRFYRVH